VRRLRDEVRETRRTFDKTEDDLKALQSMGQIIGEVLRQLDEERCASLNLLHPPSVLPFAISAQGRTAPTHPSKRNVDRFIPEEISCAVQAQGLEGLGFRRRMRNVMRLISRTRPVCTLSSLCMLHCTCPTHVPRLCKRKAVGQDPFGSSGCGV